MGEKKLSHTLLDLGFFSALGTSEHPAISKEEVFVERRSPNTMDYNNGVVVVYDEVGRPWIMHSGHFTKSVEETLEEYKLGRGAYVPHSNDGGNFMHEVVMKL